MYVSLPKVTNESSNKYIYKVNNMSADDLATQGTKASAAMLVH